VAQRVKSDRATLNPGPPPLRCAFRSGPKRDRYLATGLSGAWGAPSSCRLWYDEGRDWLHDGRRQPRSCSHGDTCDLGPCGKGLNAGGMKLSGGVLPASRHPLTLPCDGHYANRTAGTRCSLFCFVVGVRLGHTRAVRSICAQTAAGVSPRRAPVNRSSRTAFADASLDGRPGLCSTGPSRRATEISRACFPARSTPFTGLWVEFST
jgi:hypothetical protein